ncbi:WIF1 [Mytilus coruscus]|uniref:WIF1 n=1 Tax=Mytilus coruscus TaxID=42192 RepID=A0A6J8B1C7_MYTCO|nr:WIF1 [Mytilus coruscus]
MIYRCGGKCLNGGTCIADSCNCPDGYTVIKCEINPSLILTDPCIVRCLNGGTCFNNSCNCSKRYTGDYCENEYLGNGPFRKIQFITANETSDYNLPQLKTIVNKDPLYFKVAEGCAYNVTLLQEGNNHTVEFIMNDTNIVDLNIRKGSSLFTINVNCIRFRNADVFISWNSNVFTFGTVHLINDTFWKRTVKRYPLDGSMYRAIFSSGGKIAWILYEAGSTCILTYTGLLL